MGGGGSTAKEKAEAKATKEADKQMAQVEEADSSKVRTRRFEGRRRDEKSTELPRHLRSVARGGWGNQIRPIRRLRCAKSACGAVADCGVSGAIAPHSPSGQYFRNLSVKPWAALAVDVYTPTASAQLAGFCERVYATLCSACRLIL